MKHILFFIILVTLALTSYSQEYYSYDKPIEKTIFSQILGDSVEIEITLPKSLKMGNGSEYPVIYLLDKQLIKNYEYNLQTIEYLTSLQNIPEAIIIGIPFTRKNRGAWTNPNATGGKADDFIAFIADELDSILKVNYPISNFNMLIGHSRTAIFSSYALSSRYDFFNAVIANSVSNFDFGDSLQQAQFEIFLDAIDTWSTKYYYYFSVGESYYGDLHEKYVDTLNTYLLNRDLPNTLQWRYYKYKTAHDITPGLTVGRSLSDIFKEYGSKIDRCFEIAKDSAHKVPWNSYLNLYETISSDLGFSISFSDLFYNSLASTYYNNYNGEYGENNLQFALEVLLKAIETYPNDYSYFMWIGEIYITLNDYESGVSFLNRAVELIKADKTLSDTERESLLMVVRSLY
ncbi:MAG: alpha/beta hydrolase-fold protein [Bacteroidota bacterium]